MSFKSTVNFSGPEQGFWIFIIISIILFIFLSSLYKQEIFFDTNKIIISISVVLLTQLVCNPRIQEFIPSYVSYLTHSKNKIFLIGTSIFLQCVLLFFGIISIIVMNNKIVTDEKNKI